MNLARIVNNIGIGGVELTLINRSTTSTMGAGTAKAARGFTQANIDANRVACSVNGNNLGQLGGTTGGLFGAVLGVSEHCWGTKATPREIVVQVSGVASLGGTTTRPVATGADKGDIVQVNGLLCDGGHTTAKLVNTRGTVINVWNTERIDVLF